MKDYNDYINYIRKIYDVYMSMSVLNWDMETHMPKNETNSVHNSYLHWQKLLMI